jgi:hypothetical protein
MPVMTIRVLLAVLCVRTTLGSSPATSAAPGRARLRDELRQSGDANMCATPHGLHPCECVHEVPSGTRAEEFHDAATDKRTLRLHFPNNTMSEQHACARAPPDPPTHPSTNTSQDAHPSSRHARLSTSPCTLGWAHAAPMEAFYYTAAGVSVATFSAQYTVPDPPASTSANILYYWIGLQDRGSSANPVIQPVLSYVPGASANGWYFESWNCCPAGHKLKATSVPISGPGERLTGSMARDASGVWTVTSRNAAGAESVLQSDDRNSGLVTSWDWVDVVLETYRVDSCAQYSAGRAMTFDNMALVTSDGQSLAPPASSFSFSPYINGKYLSPEESEEFTACCHGQFQVDWPAATMAQNSDQMLVPYTGAVRPLPAPGPASLSHSVTVL